MQKFQTILDSLPNLTRDQLNELIARANFLKQGRPQNHTERATQREDDTTQNHSLPATHQTKDFKSLIHDAIDDYLTGQGLPRRGVAFIAKIEPSNSADKIAVVEKFVTGACSKRVEQRAVLNLGMRLLGSYLVAIRVPLGPRNMLIHVDKIPELINREFPGYAAAGMLGLVLRREHSNAP